MKFLNKLFLFSTFIFLIFTETACDNKKNEEINKWTISFITDGGTIIEDIIVNEGLEIQEPDAPVYYGHTFDGWYKDIDFNTKVTWPYKVTKDDTFYAKWTANKYTLNFVTNSSTEIDPIEEEFGYPISKPTNPKQTGYLFKGWYEDEELTKEVTWPITITSDITLYGKWELIKYTITFNSNDGSEIPTINEGHGSIINAPANPSKPGYRFIGWYQDSNLKSSVQWPYTLTENKTFYAAWSMLLGTSELQSILFQGFKPDLLTYIPQSMLPKVFDTVDGNQIDYSKFIDIHMLPNHGIGVQWMTVLDNIKIAETFLNYLDVIDDLSDDVLAGYQEFLDSGSISEAYISQIGDYKIRVFNNTQKATFTIEYSTIQIHMEYDLIKTSKSARIELDEDNIFKFDLNSNSLNFYFKYLGIRENHSYIFKSSDNEISGNIFEFLLDGKSLKEQTAITYEVDENYVNVIGNKKDPLTNINGVVNELYLKFDGRYIGYYAQESLMLQGKDVKNNTIWVNAYNVTGIYKIKKLDEANGDNPDTIYLNDSASAFATRLIEGTGPTANIRRFDIEFRTQYFYYYDSQSNLINISLDIPMMFIHKDYVSDYIFEIKTANPNLNNLLLQQNYLDTMKEVFDSNIDFYLLYNSTVIWDSAFLKSILGSRVVI